MEKKKKHLYEAQTRSLERLRARSCKTPIHTEIQIRNTISRNRDGISAFHKVKPRHSETKRGPGRHPGIQTRASLYPIWAVSAKFCPRGESRILTLSSHWISIFGIVSTHIDRWELCIQISRERRSCSSTLHRRDAAADTPAAAMLTLHVKCKTSGPGSGCSRNPSNVIANVSF